MTVCFATRGHPCDCAKHLEALLFLFTYFPLSLFFFFLLQLLATSCSNSDLAEEFHALIKSPWHTLPRLGCSLWRGIIHQCSLAGLIPSLRYLSGQINIDVWHAQSWWKEAGSLSQLVLICRDVDMSSVVLSLIDHRKQSDFLKWNEPWL